MNNHFMLLSLTIHQGGNPLLLKALKEDVEYRFYHDFDNVPSWLYDIPHGPSVSVSSIVGKNGSGKSSITEMMLRVINNFSYLAGFRENQPQLKYIPRVRATIKYWVNGKVCALTCFDDSVTLDVPGVTKLEFKQERGYNGNPKGRLVAVKDYLFYLFISNYSLNSLNSKDFVGEIDLKNDDWLAPHFHKNDGYQTPIHLNPMRTQGQIDINQEHDLSKQRLMALFTEASEKGNTDIDNLYGVPTGEGYIFKLSRESKLMDKTFRDYFKQHRGVHDTLERIDFKRNTHLDFWVRNAEFILDKRDFINSVYKSCTRARKKRTGFSLYLDQVEECISEQKGSTYDIIKEVVALLRSFPSFTFIEFQRVFLVLWIERRWESEHLVSKSFELKSVFVQMDHLRVNAQKYIIYKTVSIFETYPLLFDGCIGKIEKPINFFALPSEENGFEKRMEKAFKMLLDDIKKEKSYITLKIRQCINYLNHFSDYTSWNIPPETSRFSVPGKEYTHYVSFKDLLADIRKNTKGSVIDFLPPPIFEGEIILRCKGECYPTSHISSGERQMLNMVGAVVYNLRNLSASPNKGRSFRYKNIHVFLDEIELCFHPAYQREMVNYLLGQIAAAHLPEDMRLSISLLTHSPFVLSDIPQANVLYLRDGNPANDEISVNPFAANVNDILQQSFFLEDGFTGKYACEKIKSLIEFLSVDGDNNKHLSTSHWDADEVAAFISIIGEPLLKMELNRLFFNWKAHVGLLNTVEEKRQIEALAKVFGGSVKW